MQVPAVHTIWTENWHLWHVVVSAFAGGTGVRILAYISKAVPPLPANAGWWTQFAYSLLKGASGVDPNTVSLKPYDGSVDRRKPEAPKQ